MTNTKTFRRNRIRQRIKKVISGTSDYPRLSVFRSNKEIYCQVIDDEQIGELDVIFTHELKVENIPTRATIFYDNRNNGHHVYNVYPSITTNPYISTTTNDPLCKITGAEAPQTLTTG